MGDYGAAWGPQEKTGRGKILMMVMSDAAYAHWLFAQPCEFIAGCTGLETLPAPLLPELAFAGRSNVGKSSLINALTGRRTLAKTSATPGRTKQLNFFSLAEQLILVDLPGYGYARAPQGEINRWTRLMKQYLKGRVTLRRVCLLIDSRRGITPDDETMMDMLDESAVPYQAVLTKLDKMPAAELDTVQSNLARALVKHPAAMPESLATSAEKRIGIEALRMAIAELAERKP